MPYDAFISYSRKDIDFGRKLEKSLESYRPPKGLAVPQRRLQIFRDEGDLTGTEYFQSIENHLRDAAKLIVICSPNARKSKFVNDEIRRFAKIKKPTDIIPVLISGIPNNEAEPRQEPEMAFPEALCEVMQLPLAASYLGYSARHDKVTKGSFAGPWYTVLANLYEVSRSEIEQRDRKRESRRRRVITAIVSGVMAALTTLSIVAWWQRNTAIKRGRIALSRQLAAQSALQLEDQLDLAALLAVKAFDVADTLEARSRLLAVLQYNPRITSFLKGHKAGVKSLAFSPDQRILASGSWDGTILLWDIQARRPIVPPLRHSNDVQDIAFSPDGAILASAGCADYEGGLCKRGQVRLWDMATRQPLEPILTAHEGWVYSVAFSPDGSLLASGGTDDTVVFWDMANRQLASGPIHVGQWVESLAFSPDGQILAVGGRGHTIVLLDVATGRPIGSLEGHKGSVYTVAYASLHNGESAGKSLLASGGGDDTIILWDTRAMRALEPPLQGHEHLVNSLAFGKKGSLLVSGSRDERIFLWDISVHPPISTPLTGHSNDVLSVALSSNGETLASGDRDGTIILWSLTTGRRLGHTLNGHTGGVARVRFGPNGRTFTSMDGKGNIITWDLVKRQAARQFQMENPSSKAVFNVHGQLLANASGTIKKSTSIVLWDIATGRPTGPAMTSHGGSVKSLAFSPTDNILAAGNEDGTISLFDGNTGKLLGEPLDAFREEKWTMVLALAFSSDGTFLAAGNNEGIVKWWDVSKREVFVPPLQRHQGRIIGLVFSPGGKILASASSGKTKAQNAVVLWDVIDVKPLGPPIAEPDWSINGLAFDPKGQLLALANADGTVILLDVGARRPFGSPLRGHTDAVTAVAFSPGGRFLVSGGRDQAVVLWDLIPSSWVTRACRLANRTLNTDEWQLYLGDQESYRAVCPEGERKPLQP